MSKASQGSSLSELDHYQRAAVMAGAAHLAITAPAGAGKTRVLVERVVWLISRGAQPKRILVVTFARTAARELRERLAARGCSEVIVLTFHAWALALVRGSHLVSGRLLSESEQWQLLWKLGIHLIRTDQPVPAGGINQPTSVNRPTLSQFCRTNNWSEPFFLRQALDAISGLRSHGLTADHPKLMAIAQSDPFAAFVVQLLGAYNALLQKHGVTDFTRVIQAALERSLTFAPHYQHVLIDEVQDAANPELALIQKYCCRAETHTWVGDPNQSLYGWRGSAGTIPTSSPSYDQPQSTTPTQRLSLRYNYRSDGAIIQLVNDFLQTSPQATPILAYRESLCIPHLIGYPRYLEDRLCTRLIQELIQQKYRQEDIVVLARAHLPLERLLVTRQKYLTVRFATVHAFKGLESPAVIVLNVAQNRFGFPAASAPYTSSLTHLTRYDRAREERNIFYVAMTRARERLIICRPLTECSPFTESLPRASRRYATLSITNP